MNHYCDFLGVGIVIALILVIVIVVVVLIVAMGKSSVQYQSLPEFQNVSGSVPPQFKTVLTQPAAQTMSQLAALAKNHISATSQFSVSYTGVAYFRPSGALGSVASINSQLSVNESKYGNDTKLYMNAGGIPILGNAKIIYLHMMNGSYVCTNLNMSSVQSGNYLNAVFGNRNVTCVISNMSGGINWSDVANFNMSVLERSGINISYTKDYQSTYNGAPCTYISGNMTEQAANGTKGNVGALGMCMSDTYYVPLSFSVRQQQPRERVPQSK